MDSLDIRNAPNHPRTNEESVPVQEFATELCESVHESESPHFLTEIASEKSVQICNAIEVAALKIGKLR
jgi:hypothetical protein